MFDVCKDAGAAKTQKIGVFQTAAYFTWAVGTNRKIWTHRRAWFLCQEPEPKKHEPPAKNDTQHDDTQQDTRRRTRPKARTKRAEKAAAARRNANDDPNRITDIKLGFINKEILTKFLSGDGDERKLNKISVDDMFEIEFYYVKSYSQTWNEMIWNCSDYDFHWRNMRYNTSSCVAAIMCDVDNDEEY